MPRTPDSAQLDLAQVFARVQSKLLADLDLAHNFEHPTAAGTATELLWLDLLTAYLPHRYRAAPAFIINAQGQRSRQIDIAIFDNVHAMPLFPHAAGIHLPIESIYAVFEVKAALSPQWLRDASEKATSVTTLSTTDRPIITGILATTSVWHPDNFPTKLRTCLADLPAEGKLTAGCALQHGSFSVTDSLEISTPSRALITFLLNLVTQLNALGQAPGPDLLEYLKLAADKP